jgi:hypothetical protein
MRKLRRHGVEEGEGLLLLVVLPGAGPCGQLDDDHMLDGVDHHELPMDALGREAMMGSRDTPPLVAVAQRIARLELTEVKIRSSGPRRSFDPTCRQQLAIAHPSVVGE